MESQLIAREIQTDIDGCITEARTLVVVNADNYGKAADIVKTLQDKIKGVESVFKPHIERAHAAHKGLLAELKQHTGQIQQALDSIKNAMNTFTTAERRRIAEEESRIAAEQRRMAETQRIAEAERMEVLAQDFGFTPEQTKESVDQILNAPMQQVTVKVAPSVPKLEGVSARTVWKYEIVDRSLIPAMFWVLNEKAIGSMVRDQKDQTSIPGVRVYSEATTIVR